MHGWDRPENLVAALVAAGLGLIVFNWIRKFPWRRYFLSLPERFKSSWHLLRGYIRPLFVGVTVCGLGIFALHRTGNPSNHEGVMALLLYAGFCQSAVLVLSLFSLVYETLFVADSSLGFEDRAHHYPYGKPPVARESHVHIALKGDPTPEIPPQFED
ncbi:MAG: hypothetical protein WDM91_08700 [Rhizomicrobium sp.]